MSNGSGDIIIKGGSAEVEFDGNIYPPDPSNPKKHKNANMKVTRVVITGDIRYDSGPDQPSGLDCEITVSCR